MSDDSPTKKRKANDGRATVPNNGGGGGLFSSWLGYFSGRRDGTSPTAQTLTCGGENLTQKMDAMMQMMSRMEERQLATVSNLFRIEERQLMTVSSLESRCERLESNCSVLEHMLGDMREIQLRQHQYNIMLVKNQSWKYSAPVYSEEHWMNDGYDDDVAFYLSESTVCLKRFTEKLRRGEFPSDYFRKGIELDWAEEDPILDLAAIRQMRPHWEEFAKALKQFTPVFGVLPSYCESYFILENIQLAGDVPGMLKDALMNKPFQQLKFVNRTDVGDNEGMKLEDIMDIVDSNKHLRKLTIRNNRIQGHMERICSAVLYGSLVELDLHNCFERNGVNGLGNDMITSLLCTGGLAKLERLGFVSNGITSSWITLLANFLATNPLLKELDLECNGLVDDDAEALANALRSNTSLRLLNLSGNNYVTDVGEEALRLVVHGDGNNLNSIADSNHSCSVDGVGFDCWNLDDTCSRKNRARKLYKLLSERNKSTSTSNVQYFDVIDVKLLPNILEAVQRHEGLAPLYDTHLPPSRSEYLSDDWRVKPLSIVYEVMRKWDKVFPLYTDGGDNDNGSSIE